MSASKTSRPLVIASVMASLCMIAIEATIVATAMPQIAAELGGLRYYSWVFSSFLLAQTAMTVVFGKLADIYGRKPIMQFGIAIFLIGSILCGFAWSMPAMIVFRLIQGIGAGAVQPVAMTIVADLYPARERGKIQGYLASVWAISAVAGPMFGALIIHSLSWSWIYWMNVPIGLAAAYGFYKYLKEEPKRQTASVDVLGAVLFTCTVAALMVALTDVGSGEALHAWVASGAFCVFLVLFILQERRAADPMISFALWGRRPIAATNGVMLFAMMSMIGLTTFLPMYVQGVLHRTPVVAGLALTMVMLGWPLSSTLAARLFPRTGLRPLMLTGSALLPIGVCILVFLTPESSPVAAGLGSLVMGFGLGFLGVSSLVLIQDIVSASERGSATASNMFARNLGSTIGATIFGAVFSYALAHSPGVAAVTSDQLKRVLEAQPGALDMNVAVAQALQQSLHVTFIAMLVISAIVIVMTLLIPSAVLSRLRKSHNQETVTTSTH
jgi:EmrB/QacA subfamily drug resistance transporter